MKRNMRGIIKSAANGDFSPLLDAARNAPGKHWAEDARCSEMDTELFILDADGPLKDPGHVRKVHGRELNLALNTCADCPLAVAARCLVEALQHDDEYGICGGLLACERLQLRSSWRRRHTKDAVESALRGVAVRLSDQERAEVIARYAASSAYRAEVVAQGLSVTREYLAKLTYRHRQQQRAKGIQRPTRSPEVAAA